jgi:ribosomal protein L40E
MLCPKCKAENPDGASFCTLCFTRFEGPSIGLSQEELYAEIEEKHREAKVLCPNCNEVSPISSHYCLKCGFIFEDRQSLIISEEELARMREERRRVAERQLEETLTAPIEVTPQSDGGEIIRYMEEALANSYRPRMHARGRNAITFAMKLAALLSEEHKKQGRLLRMEVNLLSEEEITHPDDLALELIMVPA